MKKNKRLYLYIIIVIVSVVVLVLGATGLTLPNGKHILPIYGSNRIVDQREDGSIIESVIRYYPAKMTVTSKMDGVLVGFSELNKSTNMFKTYKIEIDLATGKEIWELIREENMGNYIESRLVPSHT